MALTMRQLLRNTPLDRHERADQVRIVKLKYGMHRVKKIPVAACESYSVEVRNRKPQTFKYITSIEFYPKKAVKVSCSCADFMYRFEYALWKAGAADLKYSNGEPPTTTNPPQIAAICKHTVKLYSTLVAKKLVS